MPASSRNPSVVPSSSSIVMTPCRTGSGLATKSSYRIRRYRSVLPRQRCSAHACHVSQTSAPRATRGASSRGRPSVNGSRRSRVDHAPRGQRTRRGWEANRESARTRVTSRSPLLPGSPRWPGWPGRRTPRARSSTEPPGGSLVPTLRTPQDGSTHAFGCALSRVEPSPARRYGACYRRRPPVPRPRAGTW